MHTQPPVRRPRRRGRRRVVRSCVFFCASFVIVCVLWFYRLQRRPEALVAAAHKCSFGLITDIQYADRPDGADITGLHARYYRDSIRKLRASAERWYSDGVDSVLELGDTIDGYNAKVGASDAASAKIGYALKVQGKPLNRIRAVGNHDLYNAPHKSLPFAEPRSLSLCSRWRVLVLDSYAVAVIGRDSSDASQASDLLKLHNPNLRDGNFTPGASDWLSGLSGMDKRWTPLNGALGESQLAWLDKELRSAEARGEHVVVVSHIPLLPSASYETDVLWDYQEALEVVRSSKAVRLVLAGHYHSGGQSDDGGVTHLTLPSPLEASPDVDECAATLTVNSDGGMLVEGHGCLPATVVARSRQS